MTLAKDIVATRDQPPFAASAMDGYAVASHNGTQVLKLIGQSAAGAGFGGKIEAGQTVRIFTGAPIPQGADSVVIQEDVILDGDTVSVPACRPNQHIRAQGVDFKDRTRLLQSGQKLDPITLALVAATGRDHVSVYRKPIVVIMSGGDEIVAPGDEPGPFDVFDSISIGLSALLQTWGASVIILAPRRDNLASLEAGFREAFKQADLIVTIGGASVGDRDLMKPSLAAFDPIFHVDKIGVRPGKPTWYATTAVSPVLGLPGNPASALVCAYLFLHPILATFAGRTGPIMEALPCARLGVDLAANGPREHYLRAVTHIDSLGQMVITPREQQDSSLLSVFQSANALLRLTAGQGALKAGALVNFLDLRRQL